MGQIEGKKPFGSGDCGGDGCEATDNVLDRRIGRYWVPFPPIPHGQEL